MSTSSIRNKAKNIISPLFTTMGHFHSQHHKVIFMCTTQEKERTKKVLMASELKRNTARLPGQPAGSEPLLCCADVLDVWSGVHRNPALQILLLSLHCVGKRSVSIDELWSMLQMLQSGLCLQERMFPVRESEKVWGQEQQLVLQYRKVTVNRIFTFISM